MIKTSYFANWRNFPKDFIPIAITCFPPKNWNGLVISALAPSKELLYSYKNLLIDNIIFEYKYIEELKDKGITQEKILTHIPNKTLFLCYEKPEDFCHRHILVKWLGFNSEECELK